MIYVLKIKKKNHHPDYTIKIEDEWLSKPMAKQSYFITHIMGMYNVNEIVSKKTVSLRKCILTILSTR